MKKLIVVASILGLLLPAAESAPAPACAAEQNHAAVIIRFGPGNEQTYCVSFAEDSISGIAALKRTGLRVVTKAYGGMGEFVCKIGSVGTEADDCPAGDNSHWRYFHGGRGSSSGASGTKVSCGTVEGWSWYAGGTGSPPSSTSFASVCSGRSCPQQASTGTQPPQQQQPGTTSGGQSSGGETGASSPGTGASRESQPRAGSPTAAAGGGALPPAEGQPSQPDESRAATTLPEEDVPLAAAQLDEPPAAGERPAGPDRRTAVIVFAASLAVALGLFAQTLLRRW